MPRPLTLCAALTLAFSLPLHAQDQASPGAGAGASWSNTIGCALPPDTEALRVTLPIEVLDELERMSSSVFVHAFLIRYISDPAAGEHRLSRCARAFTGSSLTDFRKLRQNLPDAAAIIAALRTAELARRQTEQLADSARTLGTIVAQLRTDLSAPSLESSRPQLASAIIFCGANRAGVCGTLQGAVERLDFLRQARSGLEAAGARARQAEGEAARVAEEAQAAAAALAADTVRLAQLRASAIPADSAAERELGIEIDRWKSTVDSLGRARESVLGNASRADSARRQASAAADAEQERLESTLARLDSALVKAHETLGDRVVQAIQGSPIATHLEIAAPPPTQAAAGTSAGAHSANILLELTDFIIRRMKREAVNSFIVNLHGLARAQPLLRDGFPETWGLMQGLSTLSDGRLNAFDVGRIPLTTWRATLAEDFVKLPVNLLDAGPVALCRGGEAARDSAARRNALAARATCRTRVAALRPLVPVATRLLEGDAVLDVLRDAGSFVPPRDPDLPPEWRRVSQGLSILAALSETYLAQGRAPAADPVRHPYLLTARSLAQVPQGQRDALVRLLLVRAIPSAADIPAGIDPAALQNAVTGAARLFERIAARQTDGAQPADAPLVLRSAFDALNSAADLAVVMAPASEAPWLGEVKSRWRAVSGALEAIMARDFGLSLARTTALLRDVRGVEVPGAVLTFTALASSLSEARDGGQVAAAFEAAASPVGGWQAKRYGAGGGSITAFPGLAVGFEQVIGEKGDPADVEKRATALGASLPIGLELQFRLSRSGGTSAFDCRVICGVGLYFPLIDLGALLSYRLNGPDSVEAEPNATVRQVFAPGAYLSLALTRTVPVNLLLGGQLMPSLRSVDRPAGTVDRSAFRYGVGIGMDIMLFKF